MELDEIIQILEKRPGMIVVDRSIIGVRYFINGFFLAKEKNSALSKKEEKFRDEFSQWVKEYYGCSIAKSWAEIILFYEGESTAALTKFVGLYREFMSEFEKCDN